MEPERKWEQETEAAQTVWLSLSLPVRPLASVFLSVNALTLNRNVQLPCSHDILVWHLPALFGGCSFQNFFVLISASFNFPKPELNLLVAYLEELKHTTGKRPKREQKWKNKSWQIEYTVWCVELRGGARGGHLHKKGGFLDRSN